MSLQIIDKLSSGRVKSLFPRKCMTFYVRKKYVFWKIFHFLFSWKSSFSEKNYNYGNIIENRKKKLKKSYKINDSLTYFFFKWNDLKTYWNTRVTNDILKYTKKVNIFFCLIYKNDLQKQKKSNFFNHRVSFL